MCGILWIDSPLVKIVFGQTVVSMVKMELIDMVILGPYFIL